jgi:multicomponent Na+:H+ antiporter subunit D
MLLVLPIVLPAVTAGLCLLCWGRRRPQRLLSVVGAGAHLAAALAVCHDVAAHGIRVVAIGSWPAPFGITLVADLFSALMTVVTALMGLAVAAYSLGSVDADREAFGFYPLLHVLLMGVCGAFLTGDIFNLYVWYEVMLMASFVLMALGGERPQLEGAIKYVTLNLLASTLFLLAVGLLYGVAGTLNMAQLATVLNRSGPDVVAPTLVRTLAMLFVVAFGIKAAMFPLFAWLPASYHTPPIAVTVIISALLTKVGVYSLVRCCTLLFVGQQAVLSPLLLGVSALTMVTGVLGAVAQQEVRRLLSFHIVSQIGYLVMGLALFTPLALAATVFFMVHVILAKSALFMVSGITERFSGTWDLPASGGLYRRQPWLALLFLVPALALAGLPPLSGFVAKLALVRAGLDAGRYGLVAVALGVSALTLLSMTKIWAEVYWKPAPANGGTAAVGPATGGGALTPAAWGALVVPTVCIAAATVLIGVGAGPLFSLAERAAAQLSDPAQYVQAVLGDGHWR